MTLQNIFFRLKEWLTPGKMVLQRIIPTTALLFNLSALERETEAAEARLGWDAVTNYTDGSLITDPVSYKMIWGEFSRNYSSTGAVGTATTGTIKDLDPCTTYYFAVKSLIDNGAESEPSEEVFLETGIKSPSNLELRVNNAILNPDNLGIEIALNEPLNHGSYSNITGYKIVLKNEEGERFTNSVPKQTNDIVSTTFLGLSPNHAYSFGVLIAYTARDGSNLVDKTLESGSIINYYTGNKILGDTNAPTLSISSFPRYTQSPRVDLNGRVEDENHLGLKILGNVITNRNNITIAEGGSWSATVSLTQPGLNLIGIKAEDIWGNATTENLSILYDDGRDSDGDGMSDTLENYLGYDPESKSSVFRAEWDNNLYPPELSWWGKESVLYCVQSTTNLTDSLQWTDQECITPSRDEECIYQLKKGPDSKFYRIKVELFP